MFKLQHCAMRLETMDEEEREEEDAVVASDARPASSVEITNSRRRAVILQRRRARRRRRGPRRGQSRIESKEDLVLPKRPPLLARLMEEERKIMCGQRSKLMISRMIYTFYHDGVTLPER